ncbi:ATP-binding protein [Actinoplanes sp. NPDC048967]|uniref:ATP-binding protein n=1 Tax=Actinoplanes sp. NPDC048967 TaxID=3155269 RepID=UPI0033FB32D2
MSPELNPPYLMSRTPAGSDGCVSVTADAAARVLEVAVHGRWTPALRMRAWTAVTKCFVEHPSAVVVDLRDLGDPLAASAPAWWTMAMTGARMVPPVSVVASLPATTALAARLNRLGAKRQLPVFATMPEARVAVTSRLPLTQRVQLHLTPRPEAAGQARALIADVCQAWQQPRLRPRAALIISELVGNAVAHAGTDILATVSRRGNGMHLAVTDHDPRLPVLLDQPCGNPAEVRHGLQVVHAAATLWGAIPTKTGKVVWAVVRSHRDPAPVT